MAWLFVPASEDSTSDSRSLVLNIEQSVTSRGKRMQRRYWSSAWKKGGWIRLLSGMTLPPLTATYGVGTWISFMLDYPVSPTLSQDNARAKMTSGTSGPSSSASSEKCSPPWCSSKMSQDSLPGFDLSERNYQEWVTSLRQDSLARRKSGQAISGNGCSSWPTATVEDYKGGSDGPAVMERLFTPRMKTTDQRLRVFATAFSLQDQETQQPGQQSSESGPGSPRLWKTPHGLQNKEGGGGGVSQTSSEVAHPQDRQSRQVGEPPQERDGQGQETQPAIRGVVNGLPNRVDRLRACGNAVVPLTAAWAFVNLARKLGLNV